MAGYLQSGVTRAIVSIGAVDTASRLASGTFADGSECGNIINTRNHVGAVQVTPAVGEQWIIELQGFQWMLVSKLPIHTPDLDGTTKCSPGQVQVGSSGPLELFGSTINARGPLSALKTLSIGSSTLRDNGGVLEKQQPDESWLPLIPTSGTTILSTDITDSTAVGRAVLTAVNAPAVRAAIGAGSSNLALGTTSTTAKAGDYQPASTNISDATTVGKAVLTAADAVAVRAAIGAGTSSLALGTTSATAKAGDYQPASTNISDATTVGRAVLTAVDAAAARTAIGVSTGGTTVTSTGITDSTSVGRAVLTAVDASAARTTLGAVGTTDTQALTHKDLTDGTNTFPTLNQSTTGNAATATKLATARNINGVAFDGTADVTIADSTKQPVLATTSKTTAYTAVVGDLILADATSAPFTITLPSAPADKSPIVVKKTDSSANVVSVSVSGSDHFNVATGSTTASLSLPNQAIQLQYSTATSVWVVISTDVPLSGLDARYVSPTGVANITNKTIAYGSNTITGLPYDLSLMAFGSATTRTTGTGDNPMGLKLQRACTLTSVTFRCNTAAASGNLVAQLNKNGSVISGTSTTIAAANQVAGGTSTGSWACSAGDIITVNVTAVGTTPGAGLVADITGFC